MFINSNRFTNFYRTHKTTIDTLLLLVQIIAIATALLGLLSIIGWAAAIEKAINWLNQLVADSLPPQRLLMPAKEVSPPTAPNTEADEILAEWQEKAAKKVALVTPTLATIDTTIPCGMPPAAEVAEIKAIIAPLEKMTIRQLKKLASDRAIPKYCNLTKGQLILALA